LQPKALLRLAAGASERRGERKVRAAQGAPLLKVEAVGDGWSGKKKKTASGIVSKGEKACVRDHQPAGDRRAVPTGGCKFMYTTDEGCPSEFSQGMRWRVER